METSVGIAAIFDGHGGDEASEMASVMLSSYFLMNAVFSAYKRVLPTNEERNKSHVRFISLNSRESVLAYICFFLSQPKRNI